VDPLDGGANFAQKLRYRAPLVACVLLALGAPLIALLGPRNGRLVSAGLLAGYTYSEWLHNLMHQRAPRSRIDRRMWRFHHVHHFVDSDVNFGFSTPLWDYVFGTACTYDEFAVPRVMAPRDLVEGEGFRLVGRARTGE
jgi:sterol desaturase/sphingolipid hydroxylase (fatty acid hydroxylase superfamily)